MARASKAAPSAAAGGQLKIEYLSTNSLTPDPKNARRHSAKQISRLAGIIEEFGWSSPIVIDEKDVILAGHARLLAVLSKGLHRLAMMAMPE